MHYFFLSLPLTHKKLNLERCGTRNVFRLVGDYCPYFHLREDKPCLYRSLGVGFYSNESPIDLAPTFAIEHITPYPTEVTN